MTIDLSLVLVAAINAIGAIIIVLIQLKQGKVINSTHHLVNSRYDALIAQVAALREAAVVAAKEQVAETQVQMIQKLQAQVNEIIAKRT